jgi:O-acetyl-ADP-ribose deacetylase (regulator of RNase III)
MIEREGNLFDSDQRALGHGVNCKGMMGAGIAKGFRDLYEHNYEVYKEQCNVRGLRPGGVLIVPSQGRYIVNLASQDEPGPDARYHWLYKSALEAVTQLQSIGVDSMALPLVGCGIGGLRWPVVKAILTEIETTTGFEFEVWTYKE